MSECVSERALCCGESLSAAVSPAAAAVLETFTFTAASAARVV